MCQNMKLDWLFRSNLWRNDDVSGIDGIPCGMDISIILVALVKYADNKFEKSQESFKK